MAILKKILAVVIFAALLQACEEPIQHPILGTWEGNSENSLGPVVSELKFKDDRTFVWKRTFIGLKEIMEERNPDHDWGDIGLEIIGKFTVTNDEITLSPEKSNEFYGTEDFGESMFPVFEEGRKYIHPYYFEGTELILISDTGEEISFERQ